MITPIACSSTAVVLSSPTTPRVDTASKKKLSMSPYATFDGSSGSSSESGLEMDLLEGKGCRLFKLEGLTTVFQKLRCRECGVKGVVYKEDFMKRQGLHTAPYLFCETCKSQISIPFISVGIAKYCQSTGKPTSVQVALLLAYECSLACLICLCL